MKPSANPEDTADKRKARKKKSSFLTDKGLLSLGFLLIIIVGLSWWALDIVKNQIQSDLINSLQVSVGTTQEAMRIWEENRVEDAQLLAGRLDFRALVDQLLSTPRTKEALSKNPAQAQLRSIIRPWLESKSDQGMFIISMDGINVGSMRDKNLGVVNLIKDVGDYWQKLKAGKPQLILPMRSDVLLPDIMGMLKQNEPTMFVGVPIFDHNRTVVAIFTIRINPSKDFTRIVQIARFGKTGDSYAFDKSGKLISESRFNDQLRDIGLLRSNDRSILNLALKDPGGNMLKGFRPSADRSNLPLTLMAKKAVSGESGLNINGYRDYRGVPVVGAWIWGHKYQYGLAFKLDVAEAYQSYNFIRRLIIFLLLSISVLFIIYSVFAFRSRRKTELANQQLGIFAKELESKNRELDKARLEAESAVKAKSEFLANMSHEIRTPLNAVIGFSELMGNLVVDLTQRSYLKSIQSAGKSLLTLINDILDLSKMEAGKMALNFEDTDLKSLLNEIKQIFSLKMAEKGLDLSIIIEPEIPEMLVLDEIRLRQILLNLVGNAVKFTDKGRISIYATQNKMDLENGEMNLVIEVRDTGIGIPENQQSAIFESFKQQEGQSNRKFGGTGLGLAISKRLVEMMNGTISIRSIVDEGTVFGVQLMNVAISQLKNSPDKLKKVNVLNVTSFEKSLVLVVDDVKSNRYLIHEMLKKVGMTVVEAENGKQAIQMMSEQFPDLVLMDLRMPVMDGFKATTILKSDPQTKDIPILALTASINFEDKDKVMAIGFDGFLSKPIDSASLIQEISRFIKPTQEADGTKAQRDEGEKEFQTADNLVDLPALIERLDSEFIPKWESLQGAIDMEETKTFAESLLEVAQHHNSIDLQNYSRKMIDFIDTFEIDKIESHFSAFSLEIESLRKLQ